MSPSQTLALGAFMIAAAHYVRNGDDAWYVTWVFLGVALTVASSWIAAISSDERP